MRDSCDGFSDRDFDEVFEDSDDISYPKRIQMQINEMKQNNLLMTTCLSILNKNIVLPLVSMIIDVNLIDTLPFNRYSRSINILLPIPDRGYQYVDHRYS